MSSKDGQQPARDLDDYEDRQHRITQASALHDRGPSFERDVYEYLAETDVAEIDDSDAKAMLDEFDLPPDVKAIIKDYLTKDWVLANLSDEDYTEIKWELRILEQMVYEHFPPPECVIIGDDRAYINDDPADTVEPLSRSQLVRLKAIFTIIRLRATRSKGMQQQRVVRTTVGETIVNRDSDNNGSSGGILGRIRR